MAVSFLSKLIDPMHAYGIILLSIAGFLLCRIPFAGKWFRGFDTLFHETGHALVALLVGGDTHAIDLYADTSGKTIFSAKGKIRNLLIYLAGYPFSALCGMIIYVSIWLQQQQFALLFLVSVILLNMALWIRNTYGWAWTLINLAGLFSLLYLNVLIWDQVFLVLIASWVSIDALYSSWVLLMLNFKKPAGDAGELQKITHIPAPIIAFLFLLFNLLCFVISFLLVSGNADIIKQCWNGL
jgi:hypothetical protein